MKKRPSKLQVTGAVYNWGLWLFLTLVVSTQFLSTFWSSLAWDTRRYYGRDSLGGLYLILGSNDEPYSDRSFVCVLQGRSYVAMTVNDALSLGTTKIVDTTGAAVNGYRVVKRHTADIVPDTVATYTVTCFPLVLTMDSVVKTCSHLGYNVTRDALRLIDDLHSDAMYHIQYSLPIILMPFWDNCGTARFAIPGNDGSACMFRLDGAFLSPANPMLTMKAVNRTTRKAKTWYSDVISTNLLLNADIAERQFDLLTGEERNCSKPTACKMSTTENWGTKFSCTITEVSMTSVTIVNGERYGIFLYEGVIHYLMDARDARTSTWLLPGVSDWQNIGTSCLANSYQFKILPVLLLPRLKISLVAFWSSGCQFEGQQEPFSEAWYLIYPSIVDVVLCYYSLLNTFGKLVRLRISDKLFGVTLLLLCALHWSRELLATSGWFEIDERISTAFYADELQELTLLQLLTTHVSLRINGNMKSVFLIKVAVLTANLAPVVIGILRTAPSGAAVAQMSRIETVLAVRVRNFGGLGYLQSRKSAVSPAKSIRGGGGNSSALSQYELARFGYLIYGDVSTDAEVFLTSVEGWFLLTQLAPLQKFTHL